MFMACSGTLSRDICTLIYFQYLSKHKLNYSFFLFGETIFFLMPNMFIILSSVLKSTFNLLCSTAIFIGEKSDAFKILLMMPCSREAIRFFKGGCHSSTVITQSSFAEVKHKHFTKCLSS